jgi:hypothetical protein
VELDIMPLSASAQHENQMVIGDIHNGAKLFPLLYFSWRSVEQLKLLVAHTIFDGPSMCRKFGSGDEAFNLDDLGNVKEPREDECERLKQRSIVIDYGTCCLFGITFSALNRS